MNYFDNLFKIDSNNYYGVSGLNKELSSIYIYNTFLKEEKGILVLTNSLYEANDIYNRLKNYTEKVLFFPMDDFITSEAIAISPEFKVERLITLNKLVDNSKYIVITNLMGYLRYLPKKEVWNESILNLKVGQNVKREDFIERLVNLGYERETLVTETGKLGIRGFVIDVFPIGEENPLRFEFWGDQIESIKYFNIDNQLSFTSIKETSIYPYTEFVLTSYEKVIERSQKYLRNYAEVSSISDYIDNYLCFYYDYNQIIDNYKLLRETILDYDKDNKEEIKTKYMFDIKDNNVKKEIFLISFDNVLDNIKLNKQEKYSSFDVGNYEGNLELLKKDIENYLKSNKTVVLCIEEKNTAKRIVKYLDREDLILTKENNIIENRINLINKAITSGFVFGNLVVISNNDLFKQEKNKIYKTKFKLGTKISNINNIVKGDYVVHEVYGIGIYDELVTLTKNGIKKDYIKLIYADGDILYIPVESIDRISKFSGREGISIRLNKLNTDEWQKKKAKIRKKLEDIASSLMKISAEREALKGFAFNPDDENQIIFDNEFQYQETEDQKVAINSIKTEMEKIQPMDMLLCGDVGFGKTEVAFRAIFKAVNDGKQVAYLCPTTILSSQQYKSALDRFKNFPIKIALLNRFVDIQEQKKILSGLKEGKVDVLFGTHRILSNDVSYKDLGLLIVDEEQRFGVKHKEKIKEYKATIDILTLSATPIPRTLQMSIAGIRSLSLIETPPEQRYPIQTYVLEENNNIIKEAIYKELARNGQVFVLYNRVEKIEQKVKEISNLVPEARVDFAHGQMTKNRLENKMIDFINHNFDVLVCTTIIETGIDIPNVNTLVIIDVDRYGLAQLYQIRGRIGRSNKIGFAYLMYNKQKTLNEVAVKRLNTIKEFTELGSGFKIAMRDLSIRGAGDILGKEQSGFIDTIGIELYLKMLQEAVAKLKGEAIEEEKETEAKPLIEVETHIDDQYTSEDDLKIEIHKKINEIDSKEKLNKIKRELEDRFGKINDSIETYMYEEWFEKIAKELNITNIKQTKTFIEIELPSEISKEIDGEELFLEAYNISKQFRFNYKNNKIYIILDTIRLEKHFLFYIVELLNKIK